MRIWNTSRNWSGQLVPGGVIPSVPWLSAVPPATGEPERQAEMTGFLILPRPMKTRDAECKRARRQDRPDPSQRMVTPRDMSTSFGNWLTNFAEWAM